MFAYFIAGKHAENTEANVRAAELVAQGGFGFERAPSKDSEPNIHNSCRRVFHCMGDVARFRNRVGAAGDSKYGDGGNRRKLCADTYRAGCREIRADGDKNGASRTARKPVELGCGNS